MNHGIDIFAEAKKLAALPEDSDSKNWAVAEHLIYKLNLPGLWAQICLMAAGLTEGAILKIWLLLEAVNGMRRQSGHWDAQLAQELLTKVQQQVDDLLKDDANSITRSRLLELRAYHGGWVYHATGDYNAAADCHRHTLVTATSDRGKAFARYNMIYEQLHASIVANDGSEGDRFKELLEAGSALRSVLGDDVAEDRRWAANIACHVAFFDWLVNHRIDIAEAVQAIEALNDETRPIFGSASAVMESLRILETEPDAAATIAYGIDSEGNVDWRSYALYIAGVADQKSGKRDMADAAWQEAMNIPNAKNGGHMIAAVISR